MTETQEPVAWMHPTTGWAHESRAEVAAHCMHGTEPIPLYTAPAHPHGDDAMGQVLDALSWALDMLGPNEDYRVRYDEAAALLAALQVKP